MSVRAEPYNRIIDLGCGEAPYYPRNLPPTQKYVGVDLADSNLPGRQKVTFIRADAVTALGELAPRAGDLVVAIFAAHHIGQERLLAALVRARRAGAEFLVVDPVKFHTNNWLFHWIASLAASIGGLIRATFKEERTPFVGRVLGAQVKFLLTSAGIRHLIADLHRNQPMKSAELERLADRAFASESIAVKRVGALIMLTGGLRIRAWMHPVRGSFATAAATDRFYPLP